MNIFCKMFIKFIFCKCLLLKVVDGHEISLKCVVESFRYIENDTKQLKL